MSNGFKVFKEALLALSSFKRRTEVRSVLGGTVTWCGVWFFSLIISVVLPSGQIPGIWKWPLWSVTVKSLGLGPARRMAAPGAGRPPALRTDPKIVWSWHMQPSHSSFTLPITHCISQPKKEKEKTFHWFFNKCKVKWVNYFGLVLIVNMDDNKDYLKF